MLLVSPVARHTTLVARSWSGGDFNIEDFFLHFDNCRSFDETKHPELLNLLGLLLGFAVLHDSLTRFHISQRADHADNCARAFLCWRWCLSLSSFHGNIAAALMACSIALRWFSAEVHIGYLLAPIVKLPATAVVPVPVVAGFTTNHHDKVDGVAPVNVLHDYSAAVPACIVFGISLPPRLRQSYHPMIKGPHHAPNRCACKPVVLFALVGLPLCCQSCARPPRHRRLGGLIILLGASLPALNGRNRKKPFRDPFSCYYQMLAASLLCRSTNSPPASWQSGIAAHAMVTPVQ